MNSGLVDLFGDSEPSSDEEEQLSSQFCLPPEIEKGNIEYKLKLIDPTPIRLEHLVTQLKWRLQEGLGEAVYEIGVSDNGFLFGLSDEELKKSMETLKIMCNRLGASLTIIRERNIVDPDGKIKKSVEILIRKTSEDTEFTRMRIAVLGNIESGKSSLISVLTHNELDNGQGKARLNLLRHIHEIQTGHTSSICNEIMGFNNSAQVENFGNCRTAEEILEKSSKLITFIDLAGHSKYMKTTVKGLTRYSPDFIMLVINANNGIAGTTKEHLGFSMALGLKIFIIVNKIDQVSDGWLEQIVTEIEDLIRSPCCGKNPMRVLTEKDAEQAACDLSDRQVCPIFMTSCVEGTNIDKLTKFLNILRPIVANERENELNQLPEFQVNDVFYKKKPGHILSGFVQSGSIKEHDKMLLGPFKSGKFIPVEIQTIQRYRVPCNAVRYGQSAAVSIGLLENIKEKLRKGMVLVHPKLNPVACMEFEAEIFVLFHASQLSIGFQATVHIDNVCQTATIVRMDNNELKTNETAKVVWKFLSRAEYVRPGSRMIFREGTSKGIGEIIRINTFNPNEILSKKLKSEWESRASIKKNKKIFKVKYNKVFHETSNIEC